MNKKILLIIGLIFLSGIVFSQYFLIEDCFVWDSEKNDIYLNSDSNPINLNDRGIYEYFKPITRPQPIKGFKDSVNINLWKGINLRCN
jgi:hypothetical protein